MSSKTQSANGSESEFEFIETPAAPTPTFEKVEECGVRTTSVCLHGIAEICHSFRSIAQRSIEP